MRIHISDATERGMHLGSWRTNSVMGNAGRASRLTGSGRSYLLCACIVYVWPVVAGAEVHIVPYVATQAEYNSNVFDLSSPSQAIVENGEARRDDMVLRYLGGAAASYQMGQQKLHGAIEGRRFNYEHFNQLDHDEYLLDGGLDWALSSDLDGALDYRQERRMASFADRNTSQLVLERDRAAAAKVNLKLTPEWLLQGGVKNHQLDSPIQGIPMFGLSENSANAALSYLGFGTLSAGLYAEYLRGEYRGVPGANKFDQTTLDLTAAYSISGLSDINAKLGYTQRKDQQSGTGSVSGYTGSLTYSRKLSGKTAANVQLFRRISSYTAGASSVVETGASADVNWRPTLKLAVSLDYSLTNSTLQGQGVSGTNESNRRDQYQITTLKTTYQALEWLWIEPFASYENRDSNIEIDGFNTAIVGINIRISFGGSTSAPLGRK